MDFTATAWLARVAAWQRPGIDSSVGVHQLASRQLSVLDILVRLAHLEAKVASLSAMNSALLLENEDMRKQLMEAEADAVERREDYGGSASGVDIEDLAELQEEFAARLGAADRQIADLRAEREALKQQLRQAGQGESVALSSVQRELKARSAELAAVQRDASRLDTELSKVRAELRDARTDADSRVQCALKEVALLQAEADRQAKLAAEAHELSQGAAAAQAAAQQGELVGKVTALQETLYAVRSTAAQREDELLASISHLSLQVSQDQHRTEATSLAMMEATQPLLRQVDNLAEQLAAAEVQQQEAEALWAARCSQAEGNAADAWQKVADAQAAVQDKEEEYKELQQEAVRLQEAASRAHTSVSKEAARFSKLQADLGARIAELELLTDSHNKELAAVKIQLEDALGRAMRAEMALERMQREPDAIADSPINMDPPILNQSEMPDYQCHNEDAEVVALLDDPLSMLEDASAFPESKTQAFRLMMTRWEAERAELHGQLVDALQKAAGAAAAAERLGLLEAERTRLAQELDVAMEVLGEQTVRVAELEEDIRDMKHIFHQQLEETMSIVTGPQHQQLQQSANDHDRSE